MSQWSPTGKPVPARRSACLCRKATCRQTFRHAGVVPQNNTHLRQGFGGSSAGERNPPKHDRLIAEMVYRALTHSFAVKAVPARRSACLRRNTSCSQAFRYAGVVSCVGGWKKRGLLTEIRWDGFSRNEKDRAAHNLHKGQNDWKQIPPSFFLQPFSLWNKSFVTLF